MFAKTSNGRGDLMYRVTLTLLTKKIERTEPWVSAIRQSAMSQLSVLSGYGFDDDEVRGPSGLYYREVWYTFVHYLSDCHLSYQYSPNAEQARLLYNNL